jgi:methionyl-tRNA formyltransferase
MPLRIVMMGTGGFALPTFRAILESRHTTVGLFTQPDRTGRGHHHHLNPLKELAAERKMPVFQPEKVNLPEPLDSLRSLAPDICVVAAYGQILSADLIGVPRLGTVNVHASLLPKYRGAAPIQTAILNGEVETGVTIFQIEPKLDAGPLLALEKTPIGPKETAGELESRLAVMGAALTLRVLDQLEAGTTVPLLQDSTQASRAPRLKKQSGQIDWSKTPRQIDCQVRALQPWPTAFTTLVTQSPAGHPLESPLRLTVLEVAPVPPPIPEMPPVPPGTVVLADRKRLVVQTGQGPLEIVRLRPEGKRSMSATEFLAGHQVAAGDRFDAAL